MAQTPCDCNWLVATPINEVDIPAIDEGRGLAANLFGGPHEQVDREARGLLADDLSVL